MKKTTIINHISIAVLFAAFGVRAYSQAVAPADNLPADNAPALPAAAYPGLINMTGITQYNYIREYTPDQPVNEISGNLYHRQTTGYFDGLGRPLQTVQQRGHADGHDIIQHYTYDSLGRESYKYLPHAVTNTFSQGQLHPNAYSEIMTFYNNSAEDLPYSKTEFDGSPLNRVVKEMAPGGSWVGSGRGVQYTYRTNPGWVNTDIIGGQLQVTTIIGGYPRWTIGDGIGSIPQCAGDYAAGELYATRVEDEDGKISEEFKDKSGRLVFKRTLILPNMQNNASAPEKNRLPSDYLYTHYVYDDLGRLRCVIPPKVRPTMQSTSTTTSATWAVSATALDELCYQYVYDHRSWPVEQKIPGKSPEYYLYDKRDRRVALQDGNLRGQGKWLFTFYDALNRPTVTGLVNFSGSREVVQEDYINTALAYPNTGWLYYIKNCDLFHDYALPLDNDPDYLVLSRTFYDEYEDAVPDGDYTPPPAIDPFDAGQFPAFSQPYLVASVPTYKVKGKITATQIRVLGVPEETWIKTVFYYDNKGRVIQTRSNNLQGGTDIVSNIYFFQGMLWKTITRHENPDAEPVPGANTAMTVITMEDTYNRNVDDGGGNDLVWERKRRINNGPDYQLAYYDYNHRAQVRNKQYTISNVIHEYNVRGWLKEIDAVYYGQLTKHYFTERLFYNDGFASRLYNGNIAGITWSNYHSSALSAYAQHAYGYTYDPLNRLTHAEYRYKGISQDWSKEAKDYTVSNIAYDAGGNILSMRQRHPGGGGDAPFTMDDLQYSYTAGSNKLSSVKDMGNNNKSAEMGLPDFKDGADAATEYDYDLNGNMTVDDNKHIANIKYNHLNKPTQIIVEGKGRIDYLYDAAGNRLRKTVTPLTGDPEVYDYIGSFVYRNNVLQYVLNEEGRCRPVWDSSMGTRFVYDYFFKDHLGNVRSTVTAEPISAQYLAKHEIASANIEQLLFDNIPAVRAMKPGSGAPDDTKAALLVASDSARRVGTSIMLRVMPGDRLDVSAEYFYEDSLKDDTMVSSNAVIESLIGALTGGVDFGGTPVAELPDNVRTVYGALTNPATLDKLGEIPVINRSGTAAKAYLNILFFDEQLQLVPHQSQIVQVGGPGSWTVMPANNNTILAPGFMIIYINNQSIGNDVWFDNLNISMYSGGEMEENFYYPFGLTLNEQAAGANDQPYKYQSIELEKHFGLEQYETLNRILDPQLGIFRQIDPKAEVDYSLSPFASMRNNPAFYTDPFGDVAGDFYNDKGNKIGTDGINDSKKYVVTDNKEARAVAKTDKSGGTTQVSNVPSAVQLPSDVALGESLNVLDRIIANGGLKEESSIVMKDGTVIQGQTGSMPTIVNGVQTATATLPDLPAGTTPADAEATIHSHPTTVQQAGNMIYPQSASVPSGTDKGTFSQYNTNIIVGPLGTVKNATTDPNGTLNVSNRLNGAVIYDRNTTPQVELTRKAIQNILKN